MAQLRDVAAYLCNRYPHKQELSKARLSKMVYLAELRSAATEGHRLTDRTWILTTQGPYLGDLEELSLQERSFRFVEATSIYGDPMELVTVPDDVGWPSLTEDDVRVLDQVIKESAAKEWEDLYSFVCATVPPLVQEHGTTLDLGLVAQRCRSRRAH